jgi:uncharacterized membrane protein YgdD (TMEM256/DUF423 family)
MTRDGLWIRLAALSGLISVMAGAFGAHGMAGRPMAQDLLKTGAQYEAIHALATVAAVLLARDGGRRAVLAPTLFLTGSLLFSGSLYALALGAPRLVGAVTPLGGLAFMAGWASLIWTGGRGRT